MATAPSITNYTIGKGVVSFKKDGAPSFRDLGNVPEFEFTPAVEKLDHFSSRAGTREKDRTVVIQKSATVRLVLDEWDMENVALAFLGAVTLDTDGDDIIDIFSQNAIGGILKFIGTNEVGVRIEVYLNRVEFIPGSSINLISDEWGTIELTGEVSSVGGSWGTILKLGEQGAPDNTEI